MRFTLPILAIIITTTLTLIFNSHIAALIVAYTGWDANKPTLTTIVTVAAAIGLIAGLSTAAVYNSNRVRRFLRTSAIRTSDDIAEYFKLPVLGLLPELKFDYEEWTSTAYAESIAIKLRSLGPDRPTCVTVTSSMPAEGKSRLAASLARSLSAQRSMVLLIDGDYRHPFQHRYWMTTNQHGLLQALIGEDAPPVPTDIPRLHLLTAGGELPPEHSAVPFGALRGLLSDAKEKYDWIVIDTPPLAVTPDALQFAQLSDITILVRRHGSVPYEATTYAAGELRSIGLDNVFIALTRVPVGQLGTFREIRYSRSSDAYRSNALEVTTNRDIRRRRMWLGLGALMIFVMGSVILSLLLYPTVAVITKNDPYDDFKIVSNNAYATVRPAVSIDDPKLNEAYNLAVYRLLYSINQNSWQLENVTRLHITVEAGEWKDGKRRSDRLGQPIYPYLRTLRFNMDDIRKANLAVIRPSQIMKMADTTLPPPPYYLIRSGQAKPIRLPREKQSDQAPGPFR